MFEVVLFGNFDFGGVDCFISWVFFIPKVCSDYLCFTWEEEKSDAWIWLMDLLLIISFLYHGHYIIPLLNSALNNLINDCEECTHTAACLLSPSNENRKSKTFKLMDQGTNILSEEGQKNTWPPLLTIFHGQTDVSPFSEQLPLW